MDHERRQRWEAAQEAHVVATIVLLAHQSELLLSTLPRHAAALAQAATSTTRAGGDVAELQQAVRALSLRTVAEQLRLRALRALQRAMQRAAPGLLMTTCRKGLGALTRSADLLAVWSQIAEATQGSGHSAALVRHVHDSAAVPLLVQRLCRAALLSTPTPQPPPSALLSGLLSLGGWGRGLGSPAPLPPPEPPVVTPASSRRRPAPPHSSAAEEAEAEAAVVVPTRSRDEVASQWRPGGQADQSGLEGTYRSTAPFRSRAEAEESARAAVRAAAASAAVAARVRGEAAARVAEARAAARPAAGDTAAASVAPTLPHAAGSGAPLPGWRGVHGGPAAEAVRNKRRVDHLVILVHGVGPHDQQKMDRCNGDDPTPTASPSPSPQLHPDPGPSPEPEPEPRVDRHPATLLEYHRRYVGQARANAAEILGAHFGGAGRCEVEFTHCEWHSALHKGAGLDALYGQISTDAHRPFRLRHTLVPVVLDFYAFLTPQLRQLVLDEVGIQWACCAHMRTCCAHLHACACACACAPAGSTHPHSTHAHGTHAHGSLHSPVRSRRSSTPSTSTTAPHTRTSPGRSPSLRTPSAL